MYIETHCIIYKHDKDASYYQILHTIKLIPIALFVVIRTEVVNLRMPHCWNKYYSYIVINTITIRNNVYDNLERRFMYNKSMKR